MFVCFFISSFLRFIFVHLFIHYFNRSFLHSFIHLFNPPSLHSFFLFGISAAAPPFQHCMQMRLVLLCIIYIAIGEDFAYTVDASIDPFSRSITGQPITYGRTPVWDHQATRDMNYRRVIEAFNHLVLGDNAHLHKAVLNCAALSVYMGRHSDK